MPFRRRIIIILLSLFHFILFELKSTPLAKDRAIVSLRERPIPSSTGSIYSVAQLAAAAAASDLNRNSNLPEAIPEQDTWPREGGYRNGTRSLII